MTLIKKIGNVSLNLQIVRAYAKSAEVRQKTGIIVEFSAKLVMSGGKNDDALFVLALNDMHIRADRQGILRIGSQPRSYKDSAGREQTVWPISWFPFSPNQNEKSDAELKFEDDIIDNILQDTLDFIKSKRAENEERANTPRVVPMNNPKVAALANLADEDSAKKSKDTEDTPF